MVQSWQNLELTGQKLFDKILGRIALVNAFDRTVSIDFRTDIKMIRIIKGTIVLTYKQRGLWSRHPRQ